MEVDYVAKRSIKEEVEYNNYSLCFYALILLKFFTKNNIFLLLF